MTTLNTLIVDYKISTYKLSKDTGIPYSTLSDLIAETTSLEDTSARTLYRLAKYFGVSMESLLEDNNNTTVSIYNEDRYIHIICGTNHIQYMGPKNLVSFKKINRFVGNTVYIDTYFINEDKSIYVEEDYIDLKDIFNEYGVDVALDRNTKVRLGQGKANDKVRLIDEALMVSDSMAIKLADVSSEDIVLNIVNVNRMNYSLTLRLKDFAILSTNMSKSMQKRAVESVKRNQDLIRMELSGEEYANA